MRRPVYRLRQALYGHPDAGTFWEEHCDHHVKSCGFEPIGPEWPSAYMHPKLKLYLIVYVDDFKLCGPDENMAKGWALLRKGLNIETEQRVGPEGVSFLGCRLEKRSVRLPSGRLATVWTYNMQPFLQSCVDRYLELAPKGTTLKPADTPFINESTLESTAGGAT